MSESDNSNTRSRLGQWLFLSGSRSVLTGGFVAIFVVLALALEGAGVVYVRSGSSLQTAVSSGMLSGLITLITVALSINQLILSRVFGTPGALTDRLEGSREFRRSVERIADVPTSPTDPGAFLALVAETLERTATDLERQVEASEQAFTDEFSAYTSDLIGYADHLGSAEGNERTFDVLLLTLGTEYATTIAETRRLRSEYGDRLPEGAAENLDDILALLGSVAVIRQFFKTIVIQQDLARLSRRLIFVGVLAVATAYFFAQVYTADSSMGTTLSASTMPLVASLAGGLMFAPIAVLVSHLLRVATVAMYTVSVGSFLPPEERAE